MADGAISQQAHRMVQRVIDAFQQWIVGQYLFQFLVQFEGRELQQADRLLQLRRQRKMLGSAELERLFHSVAVC